MSTYTYIEGYESSREKKEKLTLRSQPQPKLIVRLVISKVERKLIVVSILYLLVVRSCSIRKWELRNPSNTDQDMPTSFTRPYRDSNGNSSSRKPRTGQENHHDDDVDDNVGDIEFA